MKFVKGEIDGSWIIDLEKRSDERGYFARLWCEKELQDHGLSPRVAQINTGFSPVTGTLRGMHYQSEPHAEIKIMRCTRGAVYDVIVDLRPASPSYCRSMGVELTADNGRLLYMPEGCAHGYLTLVDSTELLYFTSQPYVPHAATGLRHDDPAFAVKWPGEIRVISSADRTWPDFVPAT
jgi:dTDP-4-dehydrorhamnose 3,5-epimerase